VNPIEFLRFQVEKQNFTQAIYNDSVDFNLFRTFFSGFQLLELFAERKERPQIVVKSKLT